MGKRLKTGKNMGKNMGKRLKTGRNKVYKISKHFQGGVDTYYTKMGINKEIRKGAWKYQLEEWGKLILI